MRNLLLATLLALLAAPVAYAQSAGYRIQPGDQLAITVLEDETLNRNTLVLPDGSISVPLAGSINASGRSVDAVESAIADRLASNFAVRPSVFVSVTSVERDRPHLPDLRRRPGRRARPARGRGGHHTPAGDRPRRRPRPLRRHQAHPAPPLRPPTGQERLYIFNYNAVERGGAIQSMITMREGDVIVVPERHLFE